jgi:hypothetical protein
MLLSPTDHILVVVVAAANDLSQPIFLVLVQNKYL